MSDQENLSEEKKLNAANIELLILLQLLLKTAVAHKLNNDAVVNAAKRFLVLLAKHQQAYDPTTSIAVTDDSVFINQRLVKVDASHYEIVVAVRDALLGKGVGELTWHGTPAGKELMQFMATYKRAVADNQSLEDLKFGTLELKAVRAIIEEEEEEELDIRKNVLRVYGKALIFMEEYYLKAAEDEFLPVARLRRIVQEIVDISQGGEHLFLGVIGLKEYQEHLFNHCVNVAILSLLLGRHIGFNKKQLVELGLCSLLHDLGKATLPKELQFDLAEPSDQDHVLVEQVPFRSAEMALRDDSPNHSTLVRAIVGYENSVKSLGRERLFHTQPLVYSQIVSICSDFDANTTRTGAFSGLTPDEALRQMQEAGAEVYNRDLLQAFISLVGIHPIGSTVWLDAGEIAVVFNVHRERGKFSRPVVRILNDRSGRLAPGTVVDLADNAAKGKAPHTVVGGVDLDLIPEPPQQQVQQIFFA